MTRFLVQAVEPGGPGPEGEMPFADRAIAKRGWVRREELDSAVSSLIHEGQYLLRDEDSFASFRIEILVMAP